MFPAAEKRFVKTNLVTIIVLFLVITAGGVVRSTGSGMGCPDWPRCFNRIIPPTDVSQLPAGYEQQYIAGRASKNERFAKIVELFGDREMAQRLRTDKSILVHEEFNAAKTWTEYVNRLVGVVSGICLLLTAIYSFTYVRSKSSIFVWSVINLFVVVLQAWLGSIVVSTNLMPWIITVHMLLALVIVCISIYTYFKATTWRDNTILGVHSVRKLRQLAAFSILVLLAQVVIGTGVREQVDLLRSSDQSRSDFLVIIGQQFQIHRWLAYCSLILVVFLFFGIRSQFSSMTKQSKFALFTLVFVGIQMVSGIVLARFAIPAFAQTTHLVVATMLFGSQFYLLLLLGRKKR